MSPSRTEARAPPASAHLSGGFVWARRWIAPYESLYSVLQKLAWANLATATDICSSLFGVPSNSIPAARGHPRSLLLSRWMRSPGSSLPPRFSLAAGTLSHYAQDWAHYLANDTNVRF